MLERSARISCTRMGTSSRDFGTCSRPAVGAVQSDLHGAAYVGCGNPVQRSLVEIDLQVVLHLRIFDVPVHVHHAGRGLEDLLDLLRHLDLLLVVRAVHFGDQRFQHRRTGRHLGDLEPRAVLVADLDQRRAAGAWRCRGSARCARGGSAGSPECRPGWRRAAGSNAAPAR